MSGRQPMIFKALVVCVSKGDGGEGTVSGRERVGCGGGRCVNRKK